jgi:hypothetical protein
VEPLIEVEIQLIELSLQGQVYFSNKERVPIGELADSLLALDRLTQYAPDFIQQVFSDVHVHRITAYLNSLETGSIEENVIWQLLVSVQEKLKYGLEKGKGSQSFELLKNNPNIVAWLLVALLLMGGSYAAKVMNPDKAKTQIEHQTTIILNAGRDITGLDSDALREALDKSIKSKAKLAKEAVKFAKPAKRDPSSSITINREFELSQEVLKEFPGSFLQDADDAGEYVEYDSTEIQIRATDLDSKDRGWGAIIPAFGPRRIRLHIAPGIDLGRIAAGRVLNGNVLIQFSRDEDGNIRRAQAHLYEVYWDDAE